MAKFEEIKNEFDFLRGSSPIVAFTLNPTKLEKVKEKRLEKVWELFRKDYIENETEDYYAIDEGIKLGEVSNEDMILNSQEVAYITENSFEIISNIPNRRLKDLLFGVRLLTEKEVEYKDEKGEIISKIEIVVESIDKKFFGKELSDGNAIDAIENYEYIKDEMNNIVINNEVQKSINNKEEDKEDIKQNEEFMEPSEDVIQESLKTEKQAEYMVKENNEEYERENNEAEELSLLEYIIETKEEELNQKIDNVVAKKEIYFNDNLDKLDLAESGFNEINPVLKAINKRIEYRTGQTNLLLERKRKDCKAELKNELMKIMLLKINNVSIRTSLEDEDSEFKKELDKLESDYATEKDKIKNEIESERTFREHQHNINKKDYIDKIVEKASREYDNEHFPKIEEELNNFEISKTNELNNEYNNKLIKLNNKSEGEFIGETSFIIENIFEEDKNIIDELINSYAKDTEAILEQANIENSADLKDIEDKLFAAIENEKRVNQKIKEETKNINEIKASLEEAKEFNKTLIEDNINKEKQTEIYREDLMRIIEFSKNKIIDSDEINDRNNLNKNILIKSITTLACVIVLTVGGVYAFTQTNKSTNESTTEKVIEATSTEDNKVTENSNSMYKIGDEVSININNEITSATVKEIVGKVITVQTEDGKEYVLTN